MKVAAACSLLASSAAFEASNASNMNGEYYLSQTPGGDATQSKFPTHFKDYPGGVAYFDVYSPKISTLYSQVFWKGLDPVDLPSEVVKQFAGGKAMAIVGFELDQVMTLANGQEFSVPYNVAYNHHFESHMTGADAILEKITLTGEDDPRIQEFGLDRNSCGHQMNVGPGTERWIVRELGSQGDLPSRQDFGAANGGEARKSFHGYAPGFAQVIASPEKMQITPMQIDTWHREKMNITARSPFVAGPLPRNSLAPKNASYSGLLECPVTTRIRKVIDGDYKTMVAGGCESDIVTAAECFDAAAKTLELIPHGVSIQNQTVEDPSMASACSARMDSAGVAQVSFNRAAGGAECGAATSLRAGVTESLVKLNVTLDSKLDLATISLTGPSDVWFGVGFNASKMADAPWAIVVDGDGKVTERKLQDQNPGQELEASVTVQSSKSDGGKRTVVLTRALAGKTPDHFSFNLHEAAVLPFINAIGSQSALSYHKDKTPSTLALLPVDGAGACICPEAPKPFGEGQGTLNYEPVDQPGEMGLPSTIRFDNKCEPFPRMDLLESKNPTCDVRSYVGGQIACHHMFSLLDADQEIPWVDQLLEYQLKFRFWYQEYDASYHSQILRTTWGIGSPVEYDVPKCAEGVHGCSQDRDGNWIHTISGTFDSAGKHASGNMKLAAAHFHCHAPSCISVQLYRNWNGTHGELLCEERPIFGGEGKSEPQFDEEGFILQPPCIWGSKEFGLESPPDVTGQQLHAIKTSWANDGHHGEMAWLQTYYVNEVVNAEVKEVIV